MTTSLKQFDFAQNHDEIVGVTLLIDYLYLNKPTLWSWLELKMFKNLHITK